MNDPEMNRELVRLAGEVQRLQQQLQDQAQAHELVVAGKQAEIDSARQAVEAVGKAIALLQSGNGSVGSTTGC